MVMVFVYGTLMRGFWNHKIMEQARGRFLGTAYIKNKDLYYVYEGGFPAVVDGQGIVYGEVYDVDKNRLPILDALEGYTPGNSNSMYLRKRTYAHFSKFSKRIVHYYHWNKGVNPNFKILDGKYK